MTAPAGPGAAASGASASGAPAEGLEPWQRPYPAPVTRLGPLMGAYFAAQFTLNLANGAVVNFLMPMSVDIADPAAKVANLGLISTCSAIAAIFFQPFWGLVSDRTRTRLGRRTPWILAGLVGTGTAIALYATANNVAAILVFAVSLTIVYSAASAPLFAVLADRTPPAKRGTFAALGGVGMWVGILTGVLIATQFTHNLKAAYLGFGLFTIVVGIPVALLFRRDSRELPPPGARSLRDTFRSLLVSPREHPDFAWAFLARVALIAGYMSISSFLLYILQDYIGLTRDEAAAQVPVFSAVTIVSVLLATFPGGWLSDRFGRRKPLVVGSSIMIAASCVGPIVSPTLPTMLGSLMLAGFGYGVYLSVDQALMTMVLPKSEDAGKDLGILNVAQSLGQIAAPAIASVAISLAGYQAMFTVSGVLVTIGALAILPIKSVR